MPDTRKRSILPAILVAAALAAGSNTASAAPSLPGRDGARPLQTASPGAPLSLRWREAGLAERQAAAHLLDRFAHGPRPGEVEAVAAMGLETWLARQLAGDLPETDLEARLAPFRTLEMPLGEIVATYPNPGLVIVQAMADGVTPEGMSRETAGDLDEDERRALRRDLVRYGRQQGYRSQRELIGQMMAARLFRAVYGENQLAQVLTDFWYGHFYVSLTDPETRAYALAYERDAVRPHVLGDFRTLLGATARHPAMLLYLDNARSTAGEGAPTTLDGQRARRGFEGRGGFGRFGERGQGQGRVGFGSRGPGGARFPAACDGRRPGPERERPRSLNENYARELLELHTLGVDGGYTQEDVVEVARAFTGWTVVAPGRRRAEAEERLGRLRRAGGVGAGGLGFVRDREFLFRADVHDAGAKRVLGVDLPAGRGIEDGEEVLDLLARHPSTARHVAAKLAVRFVSDEPPESLVDRLAEVFLSTGGDLRALVRALAESPEFWAPEVRGAKIKSPFELAASALRALDADLERPRGAIEWIARMGEPLYLYPAPTGYPDRGEAWVNTGSLLARMNFGLQLAAGRVEGVDLDLGSLAAAGRDLGTDEALPGAASEEPASRAEALETYLALLLPGRDPRAAADPLLAVVNDPELPRRVGEAAPDDEDDPLGAYFGPEADDDRELRGAAPLEQASPLGGLFGLGRSRPPRSYPEPTPVEQVVGVILGSPEFQRR